MSTVTINTHDAFKRLIGSKFSEQQAEGIIKVIESISLDHVATKHDLKELEWRLVNKIILTGLDPGIGHLASVSLQKNERHTYRKG